MTAPTTERVVVDLARYAELRARVVAEVRLDPPTVGPHGETLVRGSRPMMLHLARRLARQGYRVNVSPGRRPVLATFAPADLVTELRADPFGGGEAA